MVMAHSVEDNIDHDGARVTMAHQLGCLGFWVMVLQHGDWQMLWCGLWSGGAYALLCMCHFSLERVALYVIGMTLLCRVFVVVSCVVAARPSGRVAVVLPSLGCILFLI